MSKPERIWARQTYSRDDLRFAEGRKDNTGHGVEYVRADVVERDLAAARAEEREACAKIAEGRANVLRNYGDEYDIGLIAPTHDEVAAAIRARGKGGAADE